MPRSRTRNGSVPAALTLTSLSFGAIPALTGPINLSKNTAMYARNSGNTADILVIGTDGSSTIQIGQANVTSRLTGGTFFCDGTSVRIRHQDTTPYINLGNGSIQFQQSVACVLSMIAKTTANGTGNTMSMHGQDETGTGTTTGGDLLIGGGTGTNTGRVKVDVGSLYITTAGKGLEYQSGANQRAGNVTMVGGSATITNTTVTANTIVLLTRKTSGGTPGTSITYVVTAGTNVVITSDNVLDTSTFSYELIEVN